MCLIMGLALAGGGRYLLQRQLWMDEIHSWLLDSGIADTTLTAGAGGWGGL